MSRRRKARLGLPPHVHAVRSNGREYFYYQPGRGSRTAASRVALKGMPANSDGTPNQVWWEAYRRLAGGEGETGAKPGSFASLITAYQQSPEWKSLGPRTRTERQRHLDRIGKAWGRLPVRALQAHHVLELRDRLTATPGSANNILRSLSAMIGWSIPRGWRSDNPCGHVKMLKLGPGYAPWSWDDIALFRAHAVPVMWQAAALALYTGQRQSDVVAMQWRDLRGGQIHVVQDKTGKRLWIPVHRDLEAVLAAMPRVAETMLISTRGTPWSIDGFKSSWANELDRPAMTALRKRRLVFHGLRKSAVVFLLEAGCSDAEVSAITGQTRQMVEHYARQVNQRKLAASAVLKWEAAGSM